MSTDDALDFGEFEVFPGPASVHSFFGYPIADEVEPEPKEEDQD
jgi:hypothetical protein